ncbi:MAG: DNA repair protein RecO [Christensenellales bacterium]
MEEITVTGIVLSSMPYREKDKLIHLFSIELGKITAILKGVSSPNAKLKYAGQPFCFAKFDLAISKEFYIVKGCELIDSFFELTEDYDNYMLSSSMLEICSIILKPEIIAENLFINLIKSLQNIVYNNVDVYLSVLKFLLSTLQIIGYGLNFNACDNCGLKFVGDIKFDIHSGTFRCSNCSGGVKVPPRDFTIIKMVDTTDISRLQTLKYPTNIIIPCLKLVFQDISERLNVKLKTIDISKF